MAPFQQKSILKCSYFYHQNYPTMVYFLALFFLLVQASTSQPTELFFPGFSGTKSDNLTLTGAAKIEENGILCLTDDTGPSLGHAFYSYPFRLKSWTKSKAFSFSTSFAFAIVPEYKGIGGHGLAFVIATSKDLKALPRQYLGIQNATEVEDSPSNHDVVAVEFDTAQDLEFRDINDNHVGVDINSLNSNASVPASYYTHGSTKQNLTLMSGKAIQAWVDYDSDENMLNVTIAPNSTRPRFPILSFHVDLSPYFHEFMYVGFSASTGLLASSHYILGWSFKINGEAQGLDLSSLPSLPEPPKKHTTLIVVVSVSSAILVILAVSAAIYFVIKIKNEDVIEDWELEVGPKRYSYQELKLATKGFSAQNLLGHGGFGSVYKGNLRDSRTMTQVAVKRVSHESKQGLREFLSEIASIGRLRHRNLVQLLGWCRRRGDLLLVYDLMANGSLDKFLFDEPKTTLNWEHRFRVIKGVAYGLLYLHEGYEQSVIHRDVKASNVLLDDELNGILGDFGLARLYEHGSNPKTTRVAGTLGYLAPEVSRMGKATTSSDVYAYGALLLEVVCGRRPIEPKASPLESGLVDWVREKYREGSVFDVVDTRLNGQYGEDEMLMVLKLGLICSNDVPVARPSMRQVVKYLDGESELPDHSVSVSPSSYGIRV
ncbi:L-type lectin-domain containing receptor kinase S.4-like [Hibiscus syriacus]|nr:L-type lectin-domain containing receptor kinase S.4-like [Hibiscus syriacus]